MTGRVRWIIGGIVSAVLGAFLSGAIGSAGFCLLTIGVMLVLLVRGEWPPEAILLGAVAFLLIGSSAASTPFLDSKSAWSGFGQPVVITVAVLFVVAAGVRQTGVMERLADWILSGCTSERGTIARLAVPLVGLSAVLNNTPIVAIFMPVVRDWATRRKLAPSKFLIPLSYLTILGGTCTLIGTSTNLLVNGMMIDYGLEPMGLFEIGKLGLPCALVGAAYLFFLAPRLLPDRGDLLGESDGEVREYLVEMEITADGRLSGANIEEAGLRHLDGLFLFQVRRGDCLFAPVKREFILENGDVCVFAGARDRVLSLQGIPGLSSPHAGRVEVGERSQLLEVVVSSSSPLVGRTLQEVRFNRKYDAAVLALHRNGERVDSSLGETALRAGDTLLLVAGIGFRRIWQQSADFYLVSPLREDLANPRKAPIALAILLLMVALPAVGLAPISVTAPAALIALVASGCLAAFNLHRHVDWNVLIVIGCAFGISSALRQSGASEAIAGLMAPTATSLGFVGALALIFIVTSVTTETITNNAAAALVFPVAMDLAQQMHVDPRAFALVVAVAASASFATPVGYQTNMMVFGPGGYRYQDFLRIGLPLNILCGIVAVASAAYFFSI